MLDTTIYELSLSPTYVTNWTVREAVRELIQNCIDSPAPFEYSIDGSTLTLQSRGVTLDVASLILGVSGKATDAHAIGSFGEGYKLALLVLTRNHKRVTIHNGGQVWSPEFRYSRQFGTTLLNILSQVRHTPAQALTFIVDDLTPEELEAIVETCLQMQPAQEDAIEVAQGRILPSRPGKLYVGGLLVCETGLEFGYDVHPELITLERDRQTVSTWDLLTTTRDMWFATDDHDRVAGMIARECKDTRYVEYSAPEHIRDACFRLFQREHPGAVAARTQAELDALVRQGLTKTVFVGNGYYSALATSPDYRAALPPVLAKPTPQEVLKAWHAEHSGPLAREALDAFHDLIEDAANWRRM